MVWDKLKKAPSKLSVELLTHSNIADEENFEVLSSSEKTNSEPVLGVNFIFSQVRSMEITFFGSRGFMSPCHTYRIFQNEA